MRTAWSAASLQPDSLQELPAIFPSYSNRIDLTLAGGQRWVIYFRDSDSRITLYDPDQRTRSFMAAVSPEFHRLLAAELGAPIDVSRIPCRLPESEMFGAVLLAQPEWHS